MEDEDALRKMTNHLFAFNGGIYKCNNIVEYVPIFKKPVGGLGRICR